MVYRATPNTVTGYSRYYLGQGRKMTVANRDNLKTRVTKRSPEQCRRLENIKTRLKLAYKHVDEANKKAHQKTKFCMSAKQKYKLLK